MDGRAAAGFIEPAPKARRLALASPSDAQDIAAFVAEPLPGSIRLSFRPTSAECSPRADASLRRYAVIARAEDGRVLAHGARCVRKLWLAGSRRWVGYLGGLRRDQAIAGDGRLLAQGLRLLSSTRADDEATHDLTSILVENRRARRVLEGGVPGAPIYHPLGLYRTAVVAAKAIARFDSICHRDVRPCSTDDMVELQTLVDTHAPDYAPVVSIADKPDDWLVARRGSKLIGGLRIWDRREHQTVTVTAYANALAAVRPLLNLALFLRHRPTLPPPGSRLSLAYVAHLVTVDDDPMLIHALVAEAARAALTRGCDRLVIGLSPTHRLASAVAKLPAWRTDSMLYAVGERPEITRCVSPEAAIL
jgi:hypothetical protein